MTQIELKSITKAFKNQVLFTDFNYLFEGGKIYGLVGHNGSGKTILMKIMCGLERPNSGEVWYNQTQLIGKDISFLPRLGTILETPGFLDNNTGFENLKQLALIDNKIDDQVIKQTMAHFGLDPLSKKKVKAYSLGMRQKLALSQAIMENPDILILDEPMNGLDKASVQIVRELLVTLKSQGKLIILASHTQEDIKLLCDEVIDVTQYHGE
ncbi:ATP-binding cassette domain-containing protein [Tuanshanicoccus lijuaniae]|uniref:ATP-binding cassette domain-containing protein n=1 Tax=Aerococcaceae bacterium zg-1292 TaxID=2774330 RepID=UPI001936B8CB|nr:ATP-binding cassette domain-containing protein [Aerococcaceae bacterium zg-1292]MBF6626189.1 ATP-binding cassette domain-containing protein [Aerococcaceae bacterium zg-BR9]QQA37656.1 ATP-binding cassette domain-containing protein [Aerococcaceae bacterium zg-1292]